MPIEDLAMSVSNWKDVATIAGALLAFATLLKGVFEYVRQGAQKRAELFVAMQRRLKESPTLDGITELLEKNDRALISVPFKDKSAFLCFFEEVAMMIKSGLIRRDVAHYMFGYYAIRCWESEYFWNEVNRQGPYWALFRAFAAEMAAIEKKKPFGADRFRF